MANQGIQIHRAMFSELFEKERKLVTDDELKRKKDKQKDVEVGQLPAKEEVFR